MNPPERAFGVFKISLSFSYTKKELTFIQYSKSNPDDGATPTQKQLKGVMRKMSYMWRLVLALKSILNPSTCCLKGIYHLNLEKTNTDPSNKSKSTHFSPNHDFPYQGNQRVLITPGSTHKLCWCY